MQSFNEARFRQSVDAALNRVKTILDNTRAPQYPADVPHEYEDKYLLVESLTNSTIVALLSVLENLGLTVKQFAQLKEWSKTRSVTLRLKAEEKCKFLRKVVREVQSDTKSVRLADRSIGRKYSNICMCNFQVSNSTFFGKSEHYTVTKVTEYFWQFDVK
jgi:hypothetical protein